MKYMLLMNYAVDGVQPMTTWTPEEIKAHIDFQNEMNAELIAMQPIEVRQLMSGVIDT